MLQRPSWPTSSQIISKIYKCRKSVCYHRKGHTVILQVCEVKDDASPYTNFQHTYLQFCDTSTFCFSSRVDNYFRHYTIVSIFGYCILCCVGQIYVIVIKRYNLFVCCCDNLLFMGSLQVLITQNYVLKDTEFMYVTYVCG